MEIKKIRGNTFWMVVTYPDKREDKTPEDWNAMHSNIVYCKDKTKAIEYTKIKENTENINYEAFQLNFIRGRNATDKYCYWMVCDSEKADPVVAFLVYCEDEKHAIDSVKRSDKKSYDKNTNLHVEKVNITTKKSIKVNKKIK